MKKYINTYMTVVFSISIFISFCLFIFLNKILSMLPAISVKMQIFVNFLNKTDNIQNETVLLNKTINIFSCIITFFLSFPFFMIINRIVRKIFNNWESLKKIILKDSYINGTWIGWYIGYSKQKRYYVERIYQTIDGILIKGITFDANSLIENSKWNSTSVGIDSDNKCYYFSYDTYSSSGKANFNGCGKMDFHYNKKYPTEMSGCTIDIQLADGDRIRSYEIKLSDNADKLENEYCLDRAIEEFKDK